MSLPLARGPPVLPAAPGPRPDPEGQALVSRAMVSKNCWHNRPLFSVAVRFLQELDHANHGTTLMFMTEVSWSWQDPLEGRYPRGASGKVGFPSAGFPTEGLGDIVNDTFKVTLSRGL